MLWLSDCLSLGESLNMYLTFLLLSFAYQDLISPPIEDDAATTLLSVACTKTDGTAGTKCVGSYACYGYGTEEFRPINQDNVGCDSW